MIVALHAEELNGGGVVVDLAPVERLIDQIIFSYVTGR